MLRLLFTQKPNGDATKARTSLSMLFARHTDSVTVSQKIPAGMR